jgi:hypothetical protein
MPDRTGLTDTLVRVGNNNLVKINLRGYMAYIGSGLLKHNNPMYSHVCIDVVVNVLVGLAVCTRCPLIIGVFTYL